MQYTIQQIAEVLSIDSRQLVDGNIYTVSVDTRQLSMSKNTLFIALPGTMNDGHQYIEDAYQKGVRNFVLTQSGFGSEYEGANFLLVDDALAALQLIAKHHRSSFPNLKTIAITGSNGKTIVKEWLYQMLHDRYTIVKSPKSYNSQIGMALSILNIESQHELGIFEAGISQKGEMANHLAMLAPQIGLFSNIGSAHAEGFANDEEKVKEKMSLFTLADTIIYPGQFSLIDEEFRKSYSDKSSVTWGSSEKSDIRIISSETEGAGRIIEINHKGESAKLMFRFNDPVAFENLMNCISVMLHLEVPISELQARINRVSSLQMRLEMTSGIEGSLLINDAYSADLDSFKMALEFTNLQAPNRDKIAILSPFDQSGIAEEEVFEKIIQLAEIWDFTKVIYISDKQLTTSSKLVKVNCYPSKAAFLENIHIEDIAEKAILIKGSRKYEFEEISEKLADKGHSANLTINLNHLEDNLRVYKSLLQSTTGIIAVVKASAYGSGSKEIGRLLENNGVDYLAVAFTDEGVELRKAGVTSPIIVLNPDMNAVRDLLRFDLEPEIYNLNQLKRIEQYCSHANQNINVHIKLDTGMHRLGFQVSELDTVLEIINKSSCLKVKTIFSHLASSEDESDDSYTSSQFALFDKMYDVLSNGLGYSFKRHILNSGGISRFPNRQYDYVRLGIGMYGIDNNPEIGSQLQKVHSLSANIIQIKEMKTGDSIGYNRKTFLEKDTKIGIVNIGYADGLMRNLGNRKYALSINNQPTPILGNVCMDLTIVDLSAVPNTKEGDTVVIFDNFQSIEELAKAAGTIPYEILSRISDRVQRKFVRE